MKKINVDIYQGDHCIFVKTVGGGWMTLINPDELFINKKRLSNDSQIASAIASEKADLAVALAEENRVWRSG